MPCPQAAQALHPTASTAAYDRRMSSRPTLRAMLWRWRRLIAATLIALCLALVVASISASGRVTPVEMMVAGRDLSAGHVLTESDIRWVEAPSGVIPGDLLIKDVSDSRLAIAAPEGTPLTTPILIGPTLADSAPDGTVVIPLILSTPQELTPVGSLVDLWVADEAGTAHQMATGATILAYSESESSSGFGSDELTYSYVAVPVDDATLVLGMSTQRPLLAVLNRQGQ
ncbi:hypothetical protein EJO69_09765 [Flaviflexus salsibiostraticola]|uniref:SAF domain-containing protein n=2 Tax=Flaviflexus salsibiostraticola TaxID=1282737 RepID=A0A3Q8WWB6_9ACTO|nr:hypothetical protein EJO69_09765 [Flaviflexus salsibiostraticola]